jgi:hypothetical protein
MDDSAAWAGDVDGKPMISTSANNSLFSSSAKNRNGLKSFRLHAMTINAPAHLRQSRHKN